MTTIAQQASCFVLLMGALSAITASAEDDDKRAPAKPILIPLPAKVPAPTDNPTTAEKVALGKQLFFDPRLSGDNKMSCATCHLPDVDKGFADGRARSQGAAGQQLSRNTQGLLDVAFYNTYFWDGRAQSLEEQALGPIVNPDEMNQNLDALEKELQEIKGYVSQFQNVFKSRVERDGIAKALAAFQRTLISRDSPFDRYLQGDKSALNEQAQRGLNLFTGEADCVHCHHGPLLSDGKFYRLGVSFRDAGRAAVTNKGEDRYKFRTPTLRNIARTAPYMHDGSMQTLQDVVIFYLRSAPATGPKGESIDIGPRNGVSLDEVDDIVAFLKALNGTPPKINRPKLP